MMHAQYLALINHHLTILSLNLLLDPGRSLVIRKPELRCHENHDDEHLVQGADGEGESEDGQGAECEAAGGEDSDLKSWTEHSDAGPVHRPGETIS